MASGRSKSRVRGNVVGVEFSLGRQDHKKVEDFLSRSSAGVSSIVLDTKAARHQSGAAEAARDAGIDVIFDPQTDRLCDPGFDLPGLAYYRPGLVLPAGADVRHRPPRRGRCVA